MFVQFESKVKLKHYTAGTIGFTLGNPEEAAVTACSNMPHPEEGIKNQNSPDKQLSCPTLNNDLKPRPRDDT